MRPSGPSPRIPVKVTITIHLYRARYSNGAHAVANALQRIYWLYTPRSWPWMLSHMSHGPDGTGAICEIQGETDSPKESDCKVSRRVNPVFRGRSWVHSGSATKARVPYGVMDRAASPKPKPNDLTQAISPRCIVCACARHVTEGSART